MGIRGLRIAMASIGSPRIIDEQDMIVRALAHGFSVIWGIVVPTLCDINAWNAHIAYVESTLLSWAIAHNLPTLSLGNETELHIDNTTLTSATMRSDCRSMATYLKSHGFSGKVTYSTSVLDAYRTPWINEGLGNIDSIGFNSYDTFLNFNVRNNKIQALLGSGMYISEFGSMGNGYADFNSELLFYYDTMDRIMSLDLYSILGYFFTYRDGGLGVLPDSFALQTTSHTRQALQAIWRYIL